MKKVYIIFLLFVVVMTYGQVGTALPLGAFHIDAKKDNPLEGNPSQQQASNDFIVDDKGQVGIGVIKPEAKLDVRGSLQVQGSLTVGNFPVLTDNDVQNLVMTNQGVVGVLNGQMSESMAFIQNAQNLNNDIGSYDKFNKAEFIPVSFNVNDLKINSNNIVATSNGNVDIKKNGYYQLSILLNVVLKGKSNGSKVFFKAQILKSSDNGVKWDLVSGLRPIIVVTNNSVSYPIYFPTSIVQLNKGDLIKVQYARSKTGIGKLQGDEVSEAYLGYNVDSGLYPYQFFISKL